MWIRVPTCSPLRDVLWPVCRGGISSLWVRIWLGLTILAATWSCAPKSASIDNVLVISVGNLRVDHLSSYGYERETDPRIAKLVQRGVIFDRAYTASPTSLVGHASLLTGQYSPTHGLRNFRDSIRESVPHVAETFASADFETAAFIGDTRLHPMRGFGRGFALYADCTANELCDFTNPDQLEVGAETLKVLRNTLELSSNERVTTTFVRWLDSRSKDRRFFAFLNFNDPDPAFVAPSVYLDRFSPSYDGIISGHMAFDTRIHENMDPIDLDRVKALYDAEIRWTDSHIGNCLDRLADYGLLENTLIVLVSTYGQPFFEHGYKLPGDGLFDEDVHVPLLFALPGPGQDAKARRGQSVSLVSVAPTIVEAAGLPAMKGCVAPSLWSSVLSGVTNESPADAAVFFETPHGDSRRTYAMLSDGKKVIRRAPKELWYVYDLGDDPAEARPLMVGVDHDEYFKASPLEDFLGFLSRYGKALDQGQDPVPKELRDGLARFGLIVPSHP